VERRPKLAELATSRLGRFASLARAGLGTASSMAFGSAGGIESAVERLGELRGIGTKVGQMAGLVESTLTPEMRERIGPALARLRAEAACSPYEAVAAIVREDFGKPPEELFATFETTPFASASLGQVHRATHHDGRPLAVKIQHPGIDTAFRGDLANISAFGRVATSFVMPDDQGPKFIAAVTDGFLAELDYVREAENLRLFAGLVARDPSLETPTVADDVSSKRVLSTTFLRGVPVEAARAWDDATRLAIATSIRRFVLSSLADHGVLYADAHAGNFLLRDDGTVGVLDFGSTFRFEEATRLGFAELRDAAATNDRARFGRTIARTYGIGEPRVAEAIAEVQWLGLGGLVRGDKIDPDHVRSIAGRAAELKKKLFGAKFSLPPFLPFFVRTLVATNALMASLDAPKGAVVDALP